MHGRMQEGLIQWCALKPGRIAPSRDENAIAALPCFLRRTFGVITSQFHLWTLSERITMTNDEVSRVRRMALALGTLTIIFSAHEALWCANGRAQYLCDMAALRIPLIFLKTVLNNTFD